jgi:hypothetical protein
MPFPLTARNKSTYYQNGLPNVECRLSPMLHGKPFWILYKVDLVVFLKDGMAICNVRFTFLVNNESKNFASTRKKYEFAEKCNLRLQKIQ